MHPVVVKSWSKTCKVYITKEMVYINKAVLATHMHNETTLPPLDEA